MPKRSENMEQGQREQRNAGRNAQQETGQSGRENSGSRSGQLAGAARPDRERGLRTEREPQAGGGMIRQQQQAPGIGSAYVVTPFSLVSRMLADMDRMLEGFGGTRGSRSQQFGGSQLRSGFGSELSRGLQETLWTPAIEMFQKKNKLVIRADLPGVSKDDVDIEFADGALIIQGERKHEEEEEQEGFYRSECSYGQFFRMIPLPEGIDADKADAKFKDGTLEITFPAPQREEKRSRRISIK